MGLIRNTAISIFQIDKDIILQNKVKNKKEKRKLNRRINKREKQIFKQSNVEIFFDNTMKSLVKKINSGQ